MTKKYVWKGDSVVAGPYDDRDEAWKAQKSRLENAEPDEWSEFRTVDEWVVSEEYDNGTIYLRNPYYRVEAFLENGRERWNAGLFDMEDDYRVIEESAEYNMSKTAAMCHLLSVVQHVDEYI